MVDQGAHEVVSRNCCQWGERNNSEQRPASVNKSDGYSTCQSFGFWRQILHGLRQPRQLQSSCLHLRALKQVISASLQPSRHASCGRLTRTPPQCASSSRPLVTFKMTAAKDAEAWSDKLLTNSGAQWLYQCGWEKHLVSLMVASVSFSGTHHNGRIGGSLWKQHSYFQTCSSCVRWLKMSLNPLLLQNYSHYWNPLLDLVI